MGASVTAVAYFAFARPFHTAASIASLRANFGATEMPLYIFADAAKSPEQVERVVAVRDILDRVGGFKSITRVYREKNLGCAESIIDGISAVLRAYDRVIVVEDDLLLAPHFLRFVSRGLTVYANRQDISSVCAASPPPERLALPENYAHDVYLSPRMSPCGWGTWRDRWEEIDWAMNDYKAFRISPGRHWRLSRGGNDLVPMLHAQMSGRIDAWDVRFNYAQIMARKYSLYPRFPYVQNLGMDGSGTHSRPSDFCQVDLGKAQASPGMPPDLEPAEEILRAVKRYHDEPMLSILLGLVPGMRWAVRSLKQSLGIDRPLLKRKHY
jgi:hypothetical protein